MKKNTTKPKTPSGSPAWHKVTLASAGLILFACGFIVRGFFLSEPEVHEVADGHDHGVQEAQDQKETVWTCSMHPQVRRFEQGLCPLCNMDLIPLTDDGGSMEGMRRLSVSENAAGLMDIAVAPVERRFVSTTVRMVGKVDYDETKLATITAWIPGRLDRLFVDYTGVPVRKGDHLVSLYSPELLGAQEELLQAIKAVENIKDSNLDIMRRTTEATLKAAREKLGLWGLASEQIAEIEQRGTPADHMTIYAPSGGIVIHKNAMEGMYVKEGTRIYTIADLSEVWVKLDAYESDLQWLRYGQTVEFTTLSYPGRVFTGTVAFIEPVLNAKTRTVKVRVNVPNTDGRLKPDMFVKATVEARVAAGGKVMDAALAGKWICPMHPDEIYESPGDCGICEMPLVTAESLGYVSDDPTDAQKPLVIPVTAALVTGTRAVVYVQIPDTEKPTYEGREIVLGPRAGEYYLVRSGLTQGERVVVRGSFKLDAELQIRAKPSMMTPSGGGAGGHDHHGGGDTSAQAGAPSIDIGALSRHQLNQVLEAGKKVRTFLDRGDMDAVDAAFYGIHYRLNAVDANQFMGEAHEQWTELFMRINNDTVEGVDAHTPEEVRTIAQSLSHHLRLLEQRFGLGATHAEHAGMSLSDELRTQLDTLMQGYLSLQKTLADDSPGRAKKAVSDVQKAVMSVDMSLFIGDTHGKWMKALPIIKDSLAKMADADDLQVQREGFFPLSQQMIGLSKTFGALGAGTVYIMHCPMAFDNRGASWLQDNEDLVNPYFGDMMLKCGTVEEVISKD